MNDELNSLSMMVFDVRIPFTRLIVRVDRIIIEDAEPDEILKELAVITAKSRK